MKRLRAHRVVPAALMAAATAIPIATTIEILAHVSAEQTITPATTAASAPATSSLAPATSTPAPATSAPPTSTPATAASRTYVGPVEYNRYGAVQATITVAGGKITAVQISAPEDNPRSAAINTQAIPILQSETLQAQSANIDIVSGATYTSEAYAQSLQAALDQAHLS
jgi:uncharacterized protein with FMN-binding domain